MPARRQNTASLPRSHLLVAQRYPNDDSRFHFALTVALRNRTPDSLASLKTYRQGE
jgi:hypothetical protein